MLTYEVVILGGNPTTPWEASFQMETDNLTLEAVADKIEDLIAERDIKVNTISLSILH